MQNSALLSLIDDSPLITDYQEYTARDGVKLKYQKRGSGRPLLLIHGLGSSSMDWELQYAELGEHFELIMPDLRGHGRSTQAFFDMSSPHQSIQQFAEDVIDLMQHLKIGSCPVLGYSMGGAIAFEITTQGIKNLQQVFQPESLIIVNSLPSFALDTLRKKYLVGLRKIFTRIFSMPKLASIIGKKLFPNDPILAEKMVVRNGRNKKRPYIASLNALLNWQVGEHLSAIEQETLFIAADNDYTKVSDKEDAATAMQNAEVVMIEDSMHGTPFDQTELFNQVVLDFLLKRDYEFQYRDVL